MPRVPYATKIDSLLKEYLIKLSNTTRIPQSKLIDEAIQDLLNKYNEEKYHNEKKL